MKKDHLMLWQLNMKKDLGNEIKTALDHYKKKYGNPPSILLLNPKWENVELPDEIKIIVQSKRFVLESLLMIGEK